MAIPNLFCRTGIFLRLGQDSFDSLATNVPWEEREINLGQTTLRESCKCSVSKEDINVTLTMTPKEGR